MVVKRKPRSFNRLARHVIEADELAPPSVEEIDELTRKVAVMICRCCYGGHCSCDRRKDMPVCSSMLSAAKVARILLEREND